jgi:hypothetical protein
MPVVGALLAGSQMNVINGDPLILKNDAMVWLFQ